MGLLFTYILTFGGAAVSIFRPYVGLLIYICFAIIRPEQLWFWSVKPGNYSLIIGIAFLLGWAFHGFGNWNLGKAWAVILPLMGFWAWLFVSLQGAAHPEVAWPEIVILSKIILPVVAGITLIDSRKKLMALAWVMILSQGFIAYEMNLAYFQGNPNVGRFTFRGWDNNINSIAMATAIGFSFFMCLHEKVLWRKGLLALLSLFMAHSVIMSYSRGGMLAMCVMGGVLFCLIPKKPIHYLAFALGLLLCFRLAGDEVRQRFSTAFVESEERDASASERVCHWRQCCEIMAARPLIGLGPSNYPRYSLETLGKAKHAHSLWLQLGAETGIVGLALLSWFYVATGWRLWGVYRTDKHPDNAWYADGARMVLASLAGFVVSSQFVSVIRMELPYYVVLFGAGALKLYSLSNQAAPGAEVCRVSRSASRLGERRYGLPVPQAFAGSRPR